jgi:hypothetical protein
MTSNFHFLAAEWPEVLEPAAKAESLVYSDPRAACFYTRRALEMAVAWIYKHDAALRLPYQDSLNALLHEPTFRNTAGEEIFSKAKIIKELVKQGLKDFKLHLPDSSPVNLLGDKITESRLYEPPYTFIHDQGVEGVFESPQVDELLSILEEVKNRAIA